MTGWSRPASWTISASSDEWFRWKNIAKSFGYFFFGLGLVLLALIIYAMLSRLLH